MRSPAARRQGVAVPDDVSVVGYDDDPLTEYLDVPLTAIRMPLWELGATAVDLVIEQLNGGPPRDVELGTEPQLIVRASTAECATL